MLRALAAFLVGVLGGLFVYLVSLEVPFLKDFAGLLGLLAFALCAYLFYNRDRAGSRRF